MSLFKRFFRSSHQEGLAKEVNISGMGRNPKIRYIEELIANMKGKEISYTEFYQLINSGWDGSIPKFHKLSYSYIQYLDEGSNSYKTYYGRNKVEKPYGEAYVSEHLTDHYIYIDEGRVKLIHQTARKSAPSAFKDEGFIYEEKIEIESFERNLITKVLLDNKRLSLIFERKRGRGPKLGVMIFDLI